LLWENDRGFLTRLLVRARVTDLGDIPYFIVVSEGEGLQEQSLIIQCEIIEQELIGALPADEEQPSQPNENGLPLHLISMGWVSLDKLLSSPNRILIMPLRWVIRWNGNHG
jgi:hypothetical protein